MARSIFDLVSASIGTRTSVYTDVETTTVTDAATLIARANPTRYGLIVVNIGDETIYVGTDERVADGRGIQLVAGGSFASNLLEDYTLPSIEWWAATTTGSQGIYTLEVIGVPDMDRAQPAEAAV